VEKTRFLAICGVIFLACVLSVVAAETADDNESIADKPVMRTEGIKQGQENAIDPNSSQESLKQAWPEIIRAVDSEAKNWANLEPEKRISLARASLKTTKTQLQFIRQVAESDGATKTVDVIDKLLEMRTAKLDDITDKERDTQRKEHLKKREEKHKVREETYKNRWSQSEIQAVNMDEKRMEDNMNLAGYKTYCNTLINEKGTIDIIMTSGSFDDSVSAKAIDDYIGAAVATVGKFTSGAKWESRKLIIKVGFGKWYEISTSDCRKAVELFNKQLYQEASDYTFTHLREIKNN